MDRLIGLIGQWEDGKGLKDENIIDFLSEVKDFEKELLKALLMRLKSYNKNLELYRYTCDICGASFKIEYETKGSLINYCPFCGAEGNNGSPLDNISFEGIYKYNAKEFE
jgi:predicted nucleic acid-binding Zn ribbon protein